MKFLASELLVDKEKITEYLLNTDHPDGRSKALKFLNYGFSVSDWQVFSFAIRKHGAKCPLVSKHETPFGIKYVKEVYLETPSSKNILIRSVWMIKISTARPTLITAYPI